MPGLTSSSAYEGQTEPSTARLGDFRLDKSSDYDFRQKISLLFGRKGLILVQVRHKASIVLSGVS